MIPARPSPVLMRFFDRYVERYLRRRFHRVRLAGRAPGPEVARERPLIFLVSHTSWWDVLVGYHLARRVVRAPSESPMDEGQLRRYRILSRLGIYSIDRGSPRGLRDFLEYTTARLQRGVAVWITAQGEIAPHWRRPVRLQPGIGHLVRRVPDAMVVPVAIVYEFLDEPRPEIFVKIGPPVTASGPTVVPSRITAELARHLEDELDIIRDAIAVRAFGQFATLLEGATSTSVVYDRVRALRRWVSGVPDPARHGDLVTDPRRRRS